MGTTITLNGTIYSTSVVASTTNVAVLNYCTLDVVFMMGRPGNYTTADSTSIETDILTTITGTYTTTFDSDTFYDGTPSVQTLLNTLYSTYGNGIYNLYVGIGVGAVLKELSFPDLDSTTWDGSAVSGLANRIYAQSSVGLNGIAAYLGSINVTGATAWSWITLSPKTPLTVNAAFQDATITLKSRSTAADSYEVESSKYFFTGIYKASPQIKIHISSKADSNGIAGNILWGNNDFVALVIGGTNPTIGGKEITDNLMQKVGVFYPFTTTTLSSTAGIPSYCGSSTFTTKSLEIRATDRIPEIETILDKTSNRLIVMYTRHTTVGIDTRYDSSTATHWPTPWISIRSNPFSFTGDADWTANTPWMTSSTIYTPNWGNNPSGVLLDDGRLFMCVRDGSLLKTCDVPYPSSLIVVTTTISTNAGSNIVKLDQTSTIIHITYWDTISETLLYNYSSNNLSTLRYSVPKTIYSTIINKQKAPIIILQTGTIIVVFVDENDNIVSTTSDDLGLTWSNPITLVTNANSPHMALDETSNNIHLAYFDVSSEKILYNYSVDNLDSLRYTMGKVVNDTVTYKHTPSVTCHPEGRIMVTLQDNRAHTSGLDWSDIAFYYTDDNGLSWTVVS